MLEALPSFTYTSGWDRLSPTSWSGADQTRDLGFAVKYGITSSIVAEATLNPDFSQVESDALQVTVNQRYPVLLLGKAPLLHGSGKPVRPGRRRATAWATWSMPVHTRADRRPAVGAAPHRRAGQGLLRPAGIGRPLPGQSLGDGEENPDLGRKATFWIGRGKLGLGKDNYIGLLYSGREFGAEYNRALAADFSFRFLKNHQLVGHYIQSFSDRPEAGGEAKGGYLTAEYYFSKGNTFAQVMIENIDPGFQMDTAYYQRSGISTLEVLHAASLRPRRQEAPLASWRHPHRSAIAYHP